MSDDRHGMSRRGFLGSLSSFAAGGALAAGGVGLMGAGTPRQACAAQPPEWPWPYAALDQEQTRKLGHKGYYDGQCSYGVFSAIVGQLQNKIGAPYTGFPMQILSYGGGGVAGWATLCGSVNGACAAISLVSKDYKKLCDELLKWYVQTEFPSETANQYAVNHEFLVDKYKSDKALPQTVAGSPLCHITVSRWCKEHGFASGSSERSERCARISGDVAAFTAGMLNAYFESGMTGAHEYSAMVASCRSCHKKGKDLAAGNWSRGKMECGPCHMDTEAKIITSAHYPQK
jgi:hypothetical protein